LAAREQAALQANDGLRSALEREGPFDLIYERYALWSFAGIEYARATVVPGLLEVNAPLIEEQAEHRGLVDRAGAQHMAERVFGAATALVAVSDEIAAYLERYPTAHGRVCVIPNAVNPDRFPASQKPSCPGRPGLFTVGFVGSLKPWHGLPILLEAFAMLHQRDRMSRLLIVGDGPERASLEADVAARGLAQAVHLTGAVAPSEVPGLLASMDVAVAPYPKLPYFYFSPLKVYEYMAAGLPVMASRIGQLVVLIDDGVNGMLCPPGDPVALAEGLEHLQRSPELRARLGQAARATVIRYYTWDSVAQRILRLASIDPVPEARCTEVG
jgi:glycosyltransferase involved in cell wall biosynthesis